MKKLISSFCLLMSIQGTVLAGFIPNLEGSKLICLGASDNRYEVNIGKKNTSGFLTEQTYSGQLRALEIQKNLLL